MFGKLLFVYSTECRSPFRDDKLFLITVIVDCFAQF